MSALDLHRFPRLGAYLAHLPAGLESHPECQTKGAVVRAMISPDPLPGIPEDALPAAVRAALAAPPRNSAWIPDTVYFSALLALADARGLHDRQFADWLTDANKRVFKSPVYRMLMSFTSPGTLLTLSGSLWGSMHRGTQLTTERTRDTAVALLQFPDRLYSPPVVETIRIAFLAAFQFSNAPDAVLELLDATSRSARFRARW